MTKAPPRVRPTKKAAKATAESAEATAAKLSARERELAKQSSKLADAREKVKKQAAEPCPLQATQQRAKQAWHVTASSLEQQAAAKALQTALADFCNANPGLAPNLGAELGTGAGTTEVARFRERLVRDVLAAINSTRHGYAEGSLASHPDGRFARRYFSAKLNRLVWLVVQPPSDGHLEAEDVNELDVRADPKWRIVQAEPWQVIV